MIALLDLISILSHLKMQLNSAKKLVLVITFNIQDSDILRRSHMLITLSGKDSQKMIQINDNQIYNIKQKKMN